MNFEPRALGGEYGRTAFGKPDVSLRERLGNRKVFLGALGGLA